MKEKIWIEKLIELLSEFINKTIFPYNRGAKCIRYEKPLFLFKTWMDVLEDTVISARYGFIKWLVENDKIDYKKIHWKEWYYKLVDTCDYNWEKRCDVLLMLLSISDTPIEDLISYLK